MIYDVIFSLAAAAELVRIMGEAGAVDTRRASQAVRTALELDQAGYTENGPWMSCYFHTGRLSGLRLRAQADDLFVD